MMQVLRQGLVIIVITCGLYVLVDLTYGALNRPEPFDSHPERLRAAAYQREPYFSRVFLRESFTQPGGWLTPEGTKLVFPKEFHGQFFQTERLSDSSPVYRRTVNPVERDEPGVSIVLLIGGSTIYNSEVPDELTVASQLARLLHEQGREPFYVINAGVTSIDSGQELERLEYELRQGLRPSIVLIYDGVNDIYNGVYQHNPDGVLFLEERRRAQAGGPPVPDGDSQNGLEGVGSWWSQVRVLGAALAPTHMYQALQSRGQREAPRIVPSHMRQSDQVMSAVAETQARFLGVRRAMHETGRQHGARVVTMLQSHAFGSGPYEHHGDVEMALALADQRLPSLRQAFDAGYPALQQAVERLQQEGNESVDLSRLFVEKDEPIFLDFCHVNSRGNRLIAEAMRQIILRQPFPL